MASVTLPYMGTTSSGSEALGRTGRSVSRKCTCVIISWVCNMLGALHTSTCQHVEQQSLDNSILERQSTPLVLYIRVSINHTLPTCQDQSS